MPVTRTSRDAGTATRAAAGFVAGPPGRIPEGARDLAGTALLDTVGVALAAAREPSVETVRAVVGAAGGPCTVLGTGGRAAPDRAALLNGVAAHAFDFDDVDDATIGHPSAVLVPAVLAAGEAADADGARAAEAYWRGLAVMRALAAGVGIDAHYRRGWHSTATLGTLAAAAATATATVLGLTAEQAEHALGIAVSRAAGSRQNFGSMTKPLHAGTAAGDGVLAASLARAGFTADRHALEGHYGFLALFNGREVPTAADRAAATRRFLDTLDDPGPPLLNVKLFPCCYATHAAADATLELVSSGLAVEDVVAVRVSVPDGGLRPLIDTPPTTGLEGKFHMAYVVASCLVDGRLRLESFTDRAVARSEVRDLATRVTSRDDLSAPPSELFRAEVTVQFSDGGSSSVRCDAPIGHARRQAMPADVLAKFDDCVAFGGTPVAEGLGRRLLGLADLPSVADLFASPEEAGPR